MKCSAITGLLLWNALPLQDGCYGKPRMLYHYHDYKTVAMECLAVVGPLLWNALTLNICNAETLLLL